MRFKLSLYIGLLANLLHSNRANPHFAGAHRTGKVYADDADKEQVKINPELESRSDIPARWWNAAIPILLIIFLVLLGLILTGVDAVQANPDLSMNIQNVFGEGDSSNSLLWATLVATLLTWALFRLTYHDGKGLMTIFKGKRTRGAQPMMHFKGAPKLSA